jgi:hypothetical protein
MNINSCLVFLHGVLKGILSFTCMASGAGSGEGPPNCDLNWGAMLNPTQGQSHKNFLFDFQGELA